MEVIDLAAAESDVDATVNENLLGRCSPAHDLLLKKGILFKDLIAIDPPKNKTGRKVKPEIGKLSVACVHAGTGKQYWRCVASSCKHFQAGNHQLSRILLHAMGCSHLSPELKSFANDMAIKNNALGLKVNPRQIKTDTDNQDAPHKKAKTVRSSLAEIAVTAGRTKFQDEVSLAVVELFAVCGIPASVLDSSHWKKFVEVATCSKFNSPSSSTLTEKLIPAEAALVRKHQSDFLRTCVNLTLTFDGGSTRKPCSVYTVHITTAERETFFMEGCDATDERHTAEYIEGLATKVGGHLI